MENRLPDIPDPLHPIIVSKTLTVADGESGITIKDDRYEVLISQVLLVAGADVSLTCVFNRGSVLVRNLELGRKLKSKNHGVDPKSVFVVYEHIYSAIRGLRAIPGRHDVEVRRITEWQRTLRWMLQTSGQLKDASASAVKAYQEVGQKTAAHEAMVRNPAKVKALERMRKATSVTDSRGRKNPGRIPPLLWSSSDLLARRQSAARGISHRMDGRIYVLVCYLDRLLRIRDQYETMVGNLLGSGILRGKCTVRNALEAMIDRLRRSARELADVHVQPFGGNFLNIAGCLKNAADCLELGQLSDTRRHLETVQSKLYLMDARRELEEVRSTLASYFDSGVHPSSEARRALEMKISALKKWLRHICDTRSFATDRNPIEQVDAALGLFDPGKEIQEGWLSDVRLCLKRACAECD